ncbi:ParA family protein [Acidiphilium acidophilum]|uniref:ParA family protein n=1 Tax=Acidiphilium acidophilum TaxID=76588 RepID=A0AAW9DMR7_ACIAO|nr:ParA family protein [Acidiphilium acidophilum]MDX5929510.1 ParA family protein [Acidiphilium acidophilum]MEE3504437.1 ParA family protein [Acidiphilium acidophilum]MEE3504493.1 ParA family protein [Acidiphilium acidophilum]GBR77111.1 ATPase [Acidiphilium acidophilum DSM 700]
MPTIVFASSKGGVGKTTSALALSFVLAHSGVRTTLIDADPNAPLVRWANRFPDGLPSGLTVKGGLGSEVAEVIDSATDPFVIVDLEGSKNVEVSVGLGRADLALIPMKGSQLDADEAASVIKLIRRQELVFRRKIPFRVFFSQTSPVIADRGMRDIESQLRDQGIPTLRVAMMDRAAFKAPFRLGGSIYSLTAADVRQPGVAIDNAEAFAAEINDVLITEHKIRAGEEAA